MVARLEEQMRKPALGWALLLGVCLAPVGPVGAQLRWESYVHGGETFSLALHGEELWVGTSGGIRIFRGGAGAVQIRELTTRDNLPGNAVSALAFEPNALWIGTRAGVTGRLDLVANTWQTFDSRAGLPAAPVAELLFDGQEVYAATLGGGVARFNVLRQDWQVWNQEDGLPNATVRCLAADPEGLWAGTDRGLLRYTRDAMMWDPVRVDQGLTGRIDDLAISGGDLWIASASDGLCRIRLADGRFLRYELGRYGVKRVSALWPTAGGDLWVATDAGLVVATADAARDWSFVEHPLGETSGLVEQDGVVWVATRRDGIWRYRAADGNWDRYESHEALPSGELTALATQASATWVGFREHGVGRHDWNTGRWETLTLPPDAPRRVRDLAARDNNLYCACQDGIAVYDQRTRTWNSLLSRFNQELLGDEWTSVLATGDRVWFAGPGRVSVFTPAMELEATVQLAGLDTGRDASLPRLLHDETSGDVWVVGRAGAYRYQARSNLWGEFGSDLFAPVTPGEFQREGRLVRDLAFDHESAWFVTLDRLAQYLKPTNQICYWSAAEVAGLEQPRLVATDRFGVWIATDQGLCQMIRASGQWTVHPWDPTLAGRPRALAVDGEEPFVWVATEQGVGRLELTADGARWRVFGPTTGLVANVRKITPTPLAVWFMGDDGLTVYRRDATEG